MRNCLIVQYKYLVIGTRAGNPAMDPTGVVRSHSISDVSGNSISNSLTRYQAYIDPVITQTLEGYVLPLLPTIPLHIHNIHLKCEILDDSTSNYQLLQLPSYKQNIGKYQVINIGNIPVNCVFYPNGTIDIYTKNSEKPFRLKIEEDRVKLIAFIKKIKDNLPSHVIVPDINLWEFTECDINRDVRVSDQLHISCVKVQVKHLDHLFRVYIKKIGNGTFCRVEETKNLKMPVIEAINHILNPFDRVERQLSDIQCLLNLRRQENFEPLSHSMTSKEKEVI
jgi:hypothetical protein